jgi:diguanylate cyclase (GGDEF)-like protein
MSSPNAFPPEPGQHANLDAGNAGHADALREELARFRRDLDQLPQDYQSLSSDQRKQAYQRLNVAAEQAVQIADSAVRSLDELVKATQRDPLTDTPNRTLMLDRMKIAVMMARRRCSPLAVMFLDLDNFKRVNDTQGHAGGDEVLKLVARRIESVVRDSDTVSRFGGDEFVVLLPEIARAADAGLIAAKMLEALAAPNDLPNTLPGVRASIGISVFPEDGDGVPALLESADAAMYRAKKIEGNSYRFSSDPPEPAGDSHRQAQNEVLSAENSEDMRKANERLVLAVLGKESAEQESEAMHGRRVRFLAMVAHELRNPLAPIRTAAELVRQASGDTGLLGRMHLLIEKQVVHMARLVDDLLDETREGNGKFRMESAPVDVAAVLRQVADNWRPAIKLKHQSLLLQLPAGALWVKGDEGRLAQVFVNLLDNANRYTPEGGRIRLHARQAGACVAVRVSDNGMGLPEDIRECIFDLFARGPDAMAVHKGGLGIGLAVARELVEAHDGEISARSQGEDLGSTFEVTLPRLAGNHASPE